jgi:Mrp family chromosome partitioning ATPase
MSTLNQAFIKVYQQHRVGAPHVRFPAPPVTPPDSPEPAAEAAAADAMAEAQDAATNAPPEPAPVSAMSAPATAATAATAEVESLPTESAATAIDDNRAAAEIDAASDSEPPSGPATIVRRFYWPKVVESLREAAVADLSWLTAIGCPRTIVTASCQRGDGGTTMALLIARHLSSQGVRVALVDADLERPTLAERLGLTVEVDWQWVWREQLPLDDALVESLADGVTLLPLRKAASADARQTVPAALAYVLGELARRYDAVCIDAGPLETRDGDQRLRFGGAFDLACVVRDMRRGEADQAETVARRLERAGVQQAIIVDNFVRATHV